MQNRNLCTAIIVVLILLLVLLLFWHPLDSSRTNDAKAPVTTVDSTTLTPGSPVTPVIPKKPVVKQQPPVQKNNSGGGTTTVIIKVVDDRATVPPSKQQVQQVQAITTPPPSTDTQTTLDPPKNKAEIIIFRFNADDGNHYPQLRFDELNDDATAMTEFPEAVWNNTRDGHNFRLTPTNTITGLHGITIDGIIYLKAAPVARWINNGIVDVKGSLTNWVFKRMTLETINGAEYYICKTK